ncbi:hypothetical protein PPROV_000762000 [Pycnococcus provasolii]|uniref:Reverse transcriptase domain-containing protein n=1 Tax=Pycnococcus provasolii TaxID=41880 RepID=A0A830HQ70_9CHLO|nr:hypothetical protein PPROV_000762000 [Pycnococcus provasolii]
MVSSSSSQRSRSSLTHSLAKCPGAPHLKQRFWKLVAKYCSWITKLLEPVVAHLRQPQRAEQREVSRTRKHIPLRQRAGHRHARLLWYMDDFLLAGRTAKETAALRDEAAGLFAKLGLTLQQEKCVWEPTQRLKHLGLIVDTKLGIFQVDEGKADKFRRLARDLLCEAQRSQRKVRKRELAAVAGLGQFVHLALRPARFHFACYLKWLGERGTVQKKSLKPYLSVINTVHKDLGYRQRPAIGSLVKSMKRAYGRKVVRIRPAPRILVMPARIILDMWHRVEEFTALPDLEYITKLPEIRALLACIVCFTLPRASALGSRPR